jgi:protease PrsW
MSLASTLAAAAVAVAVPLAFLFLVRRLDLYGSAGPAAVTLCVWWGLAAFVLAFAVNSLAARWLPMVVVITVVAPVVEELAKALVLVDRVRRPSFTYFVDGAVLGFAAGTGFAVLENLVYLARSPGLAGLGLSVNRALSTSLMHGTACALVGVALGRFRFGRGAARALSLAAGLAAAMALHWAFNNWLRRELDPAAVLVGAIALAATGLAVVALLILHGLREERAWLRSALDLDVGVSPAEAWAVQGLRQARTMLAPVGAHFGRARQAEVAELLRLQARLGLKRQAAALAPPGPLRDGLSAEVTALRAAADARRRAIGVYVMAYVRTVWPEPGDSLWARLDEAVAAGPAGGHNVWALLGARAADAPPGAADTPGSGGPGAMP